MKKRFALALSISMIAILFTASLVSAAPAPKVAICHLDDMGVFHLINISENALSAHKSHGDAKPGEPVPGEVGVMFTDTCGFAPYLTGHWEGVSGIVNIEENIAYYFEMDLVQDPFGVITGTIVYTDYPATRTVTGDISGSNLTITTADSSYSATFSTTEATGDYFYAEGTDSNALFVGLGAWR